MDIDLVCKGLGAALESIPGLAVYSEIPYKFNTPCAVVGLGKGDVVDFSSDITAEFGILVLVATSNSRGSQELLRQYVSDGTYSVQEALEADNTLPYNSVPTSHSIDWQGWDAPAIYTVGDIDYLGIEFRVEVLA